MPAPQRSVYANEPITLFKAARNPAPYRKKARYGLLLFLVGLGVWFLPTLPLIANSESAIIPEAYQQLALNIGRLIAVALLVIGAGRLIVFGILSTRRKPERVIFYDAGFVWERNGQKKKYGWNALQAVFEDPHAWFFRGKPVFQWGSIAFKMRDGEVFTFTPSHGDMTAFLREVRPTYGGEIGARYGQLIRLNKTFRVHPRLQVAPPGLILNKKKQIPWERLKLDMTARHLVIKQIGGDGDIKIAAKLPLKEIENLAGFTELVETVAETFQRPNPYA
ncbi:MAG: YcxB family protein [Chloroflexota bacterium]